MHSAEDVFRVVELFGQPAQFVTSSLNHLLATLGGVRSQARTLPTDHQLIECILP
ncbi:hypothetical protein PX52LOC_03253 [Limnoglobus roseus]|uniref:Uncharacterized protein n=1 Tax=Limnoglobus roseus TaxID=2598579 RepID=A0A5C1AA95_9BACT|nr:hypothetical protein PX52LOC_03253 [Limnoglobus roseus]